MDKKAVILLSGGIDSSTTAAIAKAEGYELFALSFEYGQRHRLELESAKRVAERLGVKKHLTINFDMRDIGGSALTADIEVPKTGIRDLGLAISKEKPIPTPPKIPITYVPARNTIFLSFALAWAEVIDAPDIFIGANAVDYSGYPDCRPEYLKAFEAMANLATKASVEEKIRFKIKAPLLYMTKADIIRKGVELKFDYSLTWSCYDPQPLSSKFKIQDSKLDFVPCKKCDSCIFRAKGFIEAGVKDPLTDID